MSMTDKERLPYILEDILSDLASSDLKKIMSGEEELNMMKSLRGAINIAKRIR